MENEKRKFDIQLRDGISPDINLIVEITESGTARKEMGDVVEFWRGWETVLSRFNGDYTSAFLFYVGRLIEWNKDDLNSVEELFTLFDEAEGFYSLRHDWFEVKEFNNLWEVPELDIVIVEIK